MPQARAQGWQIVTGGDRVTGTGDGSSAAAAALLRAWRTGDRDALEHLLAEQEPPLRALCRGMLGHPDDADDAVQETFFRALRALPTFRGDASPRTWLTRIAVNLCIEWKRARRPATAPWSDLAEEAPAPQRSPEAALLHSLQIAEALGRLPPRRRAVFLMKEQEGWSVAEIARTMGWGERQVRNELFYAHRDLANWRRREAAGKGEEA